MVATARNPVTVTERLSNHRSDVRSIEELLSTSRRMHRKSSEGQLDYPLDATGQGHQALTVSAPPIQFTSLGMGDGTSWGLIQRSFYWWFHNPAAQQMRLQIDAAHPSL